MRPVKQLFSTLSKQRYVGVSTILLVTLIISACDILNAGGPGTGGTGPINTQTVTAPPATLMVHVIPRDKTQINTPNSGKTPIIVDSSTQSPCHAWSRRLFLVGADGGEVQQLSAQADTLTFKAVIKNTSNRVQTETLPACGAFELKTKHGDRVSLSSKANAQSCVDKKPSIISYQPNEQREYILNWKPKVGSYQLSLLNNAVNYSNNDTSKNAVQATCLPVVLSFEVREP